MLAQTIAFNHVKRIVCNTNRHQTQTIQPTAQQIRKPTNCATNCATNQLLVDRMAIFVDMLALFAVMLLVLATATTATIVLITMMNDMAAVTLAYCSRVILVVLAQLAR